MDVTLSCRVCQTNKNTQDMQLIVEENLKSMIEIICGISLDTEELEYLCEACKTTIESSYKLRQLAQNAGSAKTRNTSTTHDIKVEDSQFGDLSLKIEIEPDDVNNEDENDLYDEAFVDDEITYVDEPIELIEIEDDILEVKGKIIKMSDIEMKCKKCLRMVKQAYLKDHQQKCSGNVTKHVCPFQNCQKRFVQRNSLKIHVASRHHNQKPFQCDFCQKCYASKDSLKGHMVSHRSERNETCFVCGAKFKSKLSLFKHKVIHENKIYRCSICNAKYKSKYDCNYHERVKHWGQTVKRKNPNQTFDCDQCDKVFKSNDSLKRHIIRVHKKVKDFICWAEGCSARYGFHSSLKMHIAKNHPEINLTGVKIVPDPRAQVTQNREGKIIHGSNETETVLGV